jgi:hypothetical protein
MFLFEICLASLALETLIFVFKFGHPLFWSINNTQGYLFTFVNTIKPFTPYMGSVLKWWNYVLKALIMCKWNYKDGCRITFPVARWRTLQWINELLQTHVQVCCVSKDKADDKTWQVNVESWADLYWDSRRFGCGLLCKRWRNLGCHKMWPMRRLEDYCLVKGCASCRE